jgi:hypothetical protein
MAPENVLLVLDIVLFSLLYSQPPVEYLAVSRYSLNISRLNRWKIVLLPQVKKYIQRYKHMWLVLVPYFVHIPMQNFPLILPEKNGNNTQACKANSYNVEG